MGWGNYLFGFRGRINRARFWLFIPLAVALLAGAISFGLAIVDMIHSAAIPLAIDFVVILLVNYMFVAVGVKRLHDRDKSGWWMLVLYALPMLLPNIGKQSGNPEFYLTCSSVSALLLIWMIVELGCLSGTKGPNRFGPGPLGGSPATLARETI